MALKKESVKNYNDRYPNCLFTALSEQFGNYNAPRGAPPPTHIQIIMHVYAATHLRLINQNEKVKGIYNYIFHETTNFKPDHF